MCEDRSGHESEPESATGCGCASESEPAGRTRIRRTSRRVKKRMKMKGRRKRRKPEYTVVKCTKCGTMFVRHFKTKCRRCSDCREEGYRRKNRTSAKLAYHKMKDEDAIQKSNSHGKDAKQTRWDVYRDRKKKERDHRKANPKAEDALTSQMREAARLYARNVSERSDSGFLAAAMAVVTVAFLSDGCIDDFRDNIQGFLKKVSRLPGGSASAAPNPFCTRAERFLHQVVGIVPQLFAILIPASDDEPAPGVQGARSSP